IARTRVFVCSTTSSVPISGRCSGPRRVLSWAGSSSTTAFEPLTETMRPMEVSVVQISRCGSSTLNCIVLPFVPLGPRAEQGLACIGNRHLVPGRKPDAHLGSLLLHAADLK